jgi:hypothetical protein
MKMIIYINYIFFLYTFLNIYVGIIRLVLVVQLHFFLPVINLFLRPILT